MGKTLTKFGALPTFPIETYDHSVTQRDDIKKEVSLEYGKYLAVSCVGCHYEHLKGGDPIAPGLPPPANLTSSGNLGKWTAEQFVSTLRSGVTPEGKKLDSVFMPWTLARGYTDLDLKAIHKYLKSL